MAASNVHHQLRIRICVGSEIAMGPGKADLLEAIAQTGSISAAGRMLGMSYRRTWLLVDTMNHCHHEPLVLAKKGGTHGGGAQLTALGQEALARYRRIMAKASQAIAEDLTSYDELLAATPPEP